MNITDLWIACWYDFATGRQYPQPQLHSWNMNSGLSVTLFIERASGREEQNKSWLGMLWVYANIT